jgi:hypothetical protein
VIVFGGSLWPLGSSVAFVELPLEKAVDAYKEWGLSWDSPPRLQKLETASILDMMSALLPLQMPYTKRLLVGSTSGWTAIFDNSRQGDPFPPTHLARLREVRAVVATHTPPPQSGGYPSTQFHLFGPSGEPPLMYLRTVDAGVFDLNRWEFRLSGTEQPFEDTTSYQNPRIRNRFNREMLIRYLEALGIRADDPSSYTTGFLAEDTGVWPGGWTGTLDEIRAELTANDH